MCLRRLRRQSSGRRLLARAALLDRAAETEELVQAPTDPHAHAFKAVDGWSNVKVESQLRRQTSFGVARTRVASSSRVEIDDVSDALAVPVDNPVVSVEGC